MSIVAEPSLLASVARHEEGLNARLAEADREARSIVDAARREAARLQESGDARLNEEIGKRRAAADRAREMERAGILKQADEELARLRNVAKANAPEVIYEVVAMVVPPQRGGRHT